MRKNGLGSTVFLNIENPSELLLQLYIWMKRRSKRHSRRGSAYRSSTGIGLILLMARLNVFRL